MIYFGIEDGIIPKIGNYYVFKHEEDCGTYLHIGKCVECNTTYKWAMQDVNENKIYYPYCSDVLDISSPMMSAEWKRSENLWPEQCCSF